MKIFQNSTAQLQSKRNLITNLKFCQQQSSSNHLQLSSSFIDTVLNTLTEALAEEMHITFTSISCFKRMDRAPHLHRFKIIDFYSCPLRRLSNVIRQRTPVDHDQPFEEWHPIRNIDQQLCLCSFVQDHESHVSWMQKKEKDITKDKSLRINTHTD